MLDVTAEERWACSIRTIGAVDETLEQRQARRKDELRVYERDRSRRRRTARGAIQRPIYEARSAARSKPWEALGISRATWYRRGESTAQNASPAAHLRAVREDVAALRQVRPASYAYLSYGARSELSQRERPSAAMVLQGSELPERAASFLKSPFPPNESASGTAEAGACWETRSNSLSRAVAA